MIQEQLTTGQKLKILKNFIYPDFFYKFKRMFSFRADLINNKLNYFMNVGQKDDNLS